MGREKAGLEDPPHWTNVRDTPFLSRLSGCPSLPQARPAAARSFDVQGLCAHTGFHAIRSEYDRDSGVLVFRWICEDCGRRLSEAHRMSYTPRFNPRCGVPEPARGA